jgi:hypothetical protein
MYTLQKFKYVKDTLLLQLSVSFLCYHWSPKILVTSLSSCDNVRSTILPFSHFTVITSSCEFPSACIHLTQMLQADFLSLIIIGHLFYKLLFSHVLVATHMQFESEYWLNTRWNMYLNNCLQYDVNLNSFLITHIMKISTMQEYLNWLDRKGNIRAVHLLDMLPIWIKWVTSNWETCFVPLCVLSFLTAVVVLFTYRPTPGGTPK